MGAAMRSPSGTAAQRALLSDPVVRASTGPAVRLAELVAAPMPKERDAIARTLCRVFIGNDREWGSASELFRLTYRNRVDHLLADLAALALGDAT